MKRKLTFSPIDSAGTTFEMELGDLLAFVFVALEDQVELSRIDRNESSANLN